MLIFILILSIAFPVLFLYCCLVVASKSDQAMERYLRKEREKEKKMLITQIKTCTKIIKIDDFRDYIGSIIKSHYGDYYIISGCRDKIYMVNLQSFYGELIGPDTTDNEFKVVTGELTIYD